MNSLIDSAKKLIKICHGTFFFKKTYILESLGAESSGLDPAPFGCLLVLNILREI